MPSQRTLTKSRFKLAVECPTKLFYTGKKTYRNIMQDNSFLQMLAEGGYQVGELAKLQYPEGVEVVESDNQKALERTLELLAYENVVIFEAALAYDNFFVRIDILIKQGSQIELIEVKAKSYNSNKTQIAGVRVDIQSNIRPYIEDIAFQHWVLTKALPAAKVNSFLMMPDKSIRAKVDKLNQMFKLVRDGRHYKVINNFPSKLKALDAELLVKVNVDEFVQLIYSNGVGSGSIKTPFHQAIYQWADAFKADQKIPAQPGSKCAKCEFKATKDDSLNSGLAECWEEAFGLSPADVKSGTVLDLYDYRKKDNLIHEGRVRLSALLEHDIQINDTGEKLSLGMRQWMQAHGIPQSEDRGGYWLSETHMRNEMSAWRYPYHFIDFETSSVAVPFHKGMRPYEPIAFQFSHHEMTEDGKVRHAGQFLLAEAGVFPNFEFARQLKAQLENDGGTVFMWSHHENTILSKIIIQLEETDAPPHDASDLVIFLRTLTQGGSREMYDLCKLSKEAYYHVSTKGSSSIKKVLPAILQSSKWLRDTYSCPTYGSSDGVPSLNFINFSWIPCAGSNNQLPDPYEQLRDYGSEMLDEKVPPNEDPDDLVIAEGGAAATAYSRLQFEDLSLDKRSKIESGLLRYCELDTLAMVMIVQGWKAELSLS